MLSLFTALFTNAMQAALDGTKCQDIASNEVGKKKKKRIPDLNGFRTNIVKKFTGIVKISRSKLQRFF